MVSADWIIFRLLDRYDAWSIWVLRLSDRDLCTLPRVRSSGNRRTPGCRLHSIRIGGDVPPLREPGHPGPKDLRPGGPQDYLERDVRQLAQIGDLGRFQVLLQLCAGRIGQLLNASALASEVGADVKCSISDRWTCGFGQKSRQPFRGRELLAGDPGAFRCLGDRRNTP